MTGEVTPLNGLAAVPVHLLQPSPNNPRETLREIEDLATSIAAEGLIEPIVVQRVPGTEHYQIVAGHRRYAAVKMLDMPRVLCLIARDLLPDQELARMLVENNQRVDLDPIEEARAIRKLIQQTESSQGDIARRIGRSIAFVSMRLTLLTLSGPEQARIRSGDLKITDAVERARRKANHGVTPTPKDRGWHLSDTHPLAAQVRGRCITRRHTRRLASTGCGECWEHVIRTDERAQLAASATAE